MAKPKKKMTIIYTSIEPIKLYSRTKLNAFFLTIKQKYCLKFRYSLQ